MTNEEAKEQLKQIPIHDGVSDNYLKTIYKAIDIAIEALEQRPYDVSVDKVIANGTVLPKDATNGDVIKALFPDGSQVKGASIYIMNDNKSNIFYDFDWWNASYNADKEKE